MTMRLGESRCQCSACGDYFNSTAAFDRHRCGEFAKPGKVDGMRGCKTRAQMVMDGMERNRAGFWITERREAGQ